MALASKMDAVCFSLLAYRENNISVVKGITTHFNIVHVRAGNS